MCAPDVPDTTPAQMQANQMNADIAQKQLDMQDKTYKYMMDRQEGVDAVTKQVTDRQMAMAEETQAQGRDLYDYQKSVFRPVEQSLVSQAMRESTPDYYEQYAQKAVAAQAGANANAQGQMERNLASMGVSPNSGAFASAQRGLQLANAAALGGVANDSRDRAESLGWAKKAEVAGIGKGLVGAGNASYALSSNANTSAGSAMNAASGTAGATIGTGAQFGGLAVSSAGNAAQGYNDIYKTQTSAAAQSGGGLMGAVGGIAGQFAGSANGSKALAAFI